MSFISLTNIYNMSDELNTDVNAAAPADAPVVEENAAPAAEEAAAPVEESAEAEAPAEEAKDEAAA
ncbi:MAG: hypothetical protein ACI88L_000477 [Candidatus Paceibacteria bacterium]|jgi:hypothetical protein